MQIYEVTDPLFKEYGKIIDSVELTELLAEMKHTPVPEDVYMWLPSRSWKRLRS